jgi:tetratricopeptide (TPR) repeat protein
LLLIAVGLIAAYRQARSYFWFGLVGFLLAGPFFVWITNLNLATAPSALFVLQRFFLLPQVILAPFVAFGFLWIANLIGRYWRRTVVNASLIVTAMTAVSITLRVAMDYGRIDQSRNFIERRFTEDVWRTVESGSILIARGDIAFALMYFQKVEHIGADTELVLLPLLSTRWYVQQLRDQHRNITIPFDRYDGISNNLKKVIEANSNRPFGIVGTIGSDDHSLHENYWPYQRGLLLVVEPRSKNIPLEQMIQENERFFDSYHLPSPAAIRTDTFEADIMTMYAWPAFRIANDCATVGLRDHARKWYQRALAINPQFPKAREALARLEH